MIIRHVGDVPTEKGTADLFTGLVWLDELCIAPRPSGLRVHRVTFEPRARTHWHTHPVGQVLVAMSGVGWIAFEGQAARRFSPGETVWIPPAQLHWHGAASRHLFVHLAIQEANGNGQEADWGAAVSDDDYPSAEDES